MTKVFALLLSIASLFLFAAQAASKDSDKKEALKISSSAFVNNGRIPAKHTCDGQDSNPPLFIDNVPAKAKSLALIVDDPDAPHGVWVHWVMWNIPAETKEIRESSAPAGSKQGLNDFRKNRYNGPCPPSGTHRYFFKLYALDSVIDLGTNSTKADLEKAMKGHVIEQTDIIGLYSRR